MYDNNYVVPEEQFLKLADTRRESSSKYRYLIYHAEKDWMCWYPVYPVNTSWDILYTYNFKICKRTSY